MIGNERNRIAKVSPVRLSFSFHRHLFADKNGVTAERWPCLRTMVGYNFCSEKKLFQWKFESQTPPRTPLIVRAQHPNSDRRRMRQK